MASAYVIVMGIDPIAGATSGAGAGAGAIDGSMGFFIPSMWERGESSGDTSALHIAPVGISVLGWDLRSRVRLRRAIRSSTIYLVRLGSRLPDLHGAISRDRLTVMTKKGLIYHPSEAYPKTTKTVPSAAERRLDQACDDSDPPEHEDLPKA